MTKRIWHKGPPPHVGWWNASNDRKAAGMALVEWQAMPGDMLHAKILASVRCYGPTPVLKVECTVRLG